MHFPLMIGIICTGVLGMLLGHRWENLQEYLIDGVRHGLVPIFILLIIGTIIATWIESGVIPTLIYYSLELIHPNIFIPIVALAAALLCVAIGSAFTTIATIGVAFMVVGHGMGFPPALVAGAVISGAYFGDKLSPLSDTTNLTPAVCETDLISHVKHMLWDSIPAIVLSIIIYYFVGIQFTTESVNLEQINGIVNTLDESFNLSPFLLLLPVLTVVLVIKKFPVVPTLMLVSLLGGVLALLTQGSSMTGIIQSSIEGFSADTGLDDVDDLLNQGGMTSMFELVALVVLSTGLGGIMDGVGVFKAILHSILEKARKTGSLVLLTVLSTWAVGFASGAQWLAIILPGRGFVNAYKERGLDTKNLSRCIEAGGTVGINFVPWSTNAVFAFAMLGVQPINFIPFSFFVIIVPLINIIYGFLGITIAKKNYPETAHAMEVETTEKSSI